MENEIQVKGEYVDINSDEFNNVSYETENVNDDINTVHYYYEKLQECENSKIYTESTTLKPRMSYAKLITEALENSLNGTLTLSEICKSISARHHYYKIEEPKWQNCIKSVLSAKEDFTKVSRVYMKDPTITSYHQGFLWTLSKKKELSEKSKFEFEEIKPRKSYGIEDFSDEITTVEISNNSSIEKLQECESTKSYNESETSKPRMSYAKLIAEALEKSSNGTLSLSEICKSISAQHPYYKIEEPKWQTCLRSVLSLKECFTKVSKEKGFCWKLTKNVSKAPDTDEFEYIKPRMSYSELITEALQNSPNGMLTLSEIHKSITEEHPYYKIGESYWKNSVQVKLSTDKSFTKTGHIGQYYWTLSKNPSKSPDKVKKCSFCDFEVKDGELYKQHIQSCIEQYTKSQLSTEELNVEFEPIKPRMSYSELIAEALQNSPNGMLNVMEIYMSIAAKHPYFKIGESNWKSSVQVRLSSDKSFTKTSEAIGSCWTFSKAKCYFCDFESKDDELYKQHIQSCIEQSTKSQISIKKRTNSEEISLMPSKRNKVDAESIYQNSETFDANKYGFDNEEKNIWICEFCKERYDFASKLFEHKKECVERTENGVKTEETNQSMKASDLLEIEMTVKPNLTYPQLIAEALRNSPDDMLFLSDIYQAICTKYPYYKMENKKWQDAIRYTLSVNKRFTQNTGDKHWTFSKDIITKPLNCRRSFSQDKQEYYVNGKFLCPQCGAKFTRWANLHQHLERKDHNGPHRFKRNSVIESFKNSETNDIETFQMDNFEPNLVNDEGELINNDQTWKQKCSHCEFETFEKKLFYKHVQTCIERKKYVCTEVVCGIDWDLRIVNFPCLICGILINEEETWRNHMESKHEKMIKPHLWYNCCNCGRKFTEKIRLADHIFSEHDIVKNTTSKFKKGFCTEKNKNDRDKYVEIKVDGKTIVKFDEKNSASDGDNNVKRIVIKGPLKRDHQNYPMTESIRIEPIKDPFSETNITKFRESAEIKSSKGDPDSSGNQEDDSMNSSDNPLNSIKRQRKEKKIFDL